jgi:hypothetical protein
VIIRVGTRHPLSLLTGEVAYALGRTEVKLAIPEVALVVDELEGVHPKAVYSTNRVGQAARAKEVHQSVDALWLVDVEIPKLHPISVGGTRRN